MPEMWSAMPKQMSTLNQRDTERMNADRAELAARMMLVLSGEGTLEGQPGLNFSRFSQPTELHHGFYEPCLCVIAQGAKTLTLGNEVFRYDPANYMIATIGVPMIAQVVEASPERPYLGVRLVLDPAIVSSVMVEAGIVQSLGDGDVKAVNVRTLVLLGHKTTFSCRIVLWDHTSPRQAHRRDASRRTLTVWRAPRGTKTVTRL